MLRRKMIQKWFQDYKSKLRCEICGEDHPACLEFHHPDPKQKETNVTNLLNTCSKKRILMEIEKCMILCANCHRKIHSMAV